MATCAHIDALADIRGPAERVCDECVAVGSRWLHLRDLCAAVRRNPLLQFPPQSPREQTRRHHEAPGHRIRGTRRTLALLLPGRSLCRVLITGHVTNGYAVCCKRDRG